MVAQNSNRRFNNRNQTPAQQIVSAARSTFTLAYGDDKDALEEIIGSKYVIGTPTGKAAVVTVELKGASSMSEKGNVFAVGVGTGAIGINGRPSTSEWSKVLVTPHQNQARRDRPPMPKERFLAMATRNLEYHRDCVDNDLFEKSKAIFALTAIPVTHLHENGTYERAVYLPAYYCIMEGRGMLDLSWNGFLPSDVESDEETMPEEETNDEMAQALIG